MEVLILPSMLLTASSWFLIVLLTIINQSLSARILGDQSSSHHHTRHSITFYMRDVLSETPHSSSRPVTTKEVNGNQLPFPKPLGFFPPVGGIPLPDPNPNTPVTGLSLDDLPGGIGISFPARATIIQELEFGAVTVIDESLFEGALGSVLLGKAQGMYVASSEDGSSHMVAMTASFVNGEYKDELRLFGVHRTGVPESHVAVIGGTGRYDNANGYATIQNETPNVNVNVSSDVVEKEMEGDYNYKVLSFNVFLG